MRQRALIAVAGPKGVGKTTLIERVLGGSGESILSARCVRNDSLRRARETAPKAHPELRRYRDAGATGAALFAFPEADIGSDAFFTTHLMEDYSNAVLLEGDNPLGFSDLAVFVAPPPADGETLLVRRKYDRAKEERAKMDHMERLLQDSDGFAAFLGAVRSSSSHGGTRSISKKRGPRCSHPSSRLGKVRFRRPPNTGRSLAATRASSTRSSSCSMFETAVSARVANSF